MLTKLRLKNFKAWEDSGQLRLAPLTVLFGTNSAGKTSIPQLLLLLKQTAESPDRQRALNLGDNRTLVDLGTFDDLAHGHDVKKPVGFELEWSLDSLFHVADPISEATYSGDTLGFAARLSADSQHQPHTEWLRYELKAKTAPTDGSTGLETQLALELQRKEEVLPRGKKPAFELTSSQYKLIRKPGRPWPLPEPLRFYGFPDEVAAYFQNSVFAADLVLELERMFHRLFYVGPLRESPRRLYPWSGEIPEHVGSRGDRAIEAILAAGERAYNLKPKQHLKTLPALVAERLKAMGLIHDFTVKPLGRHRKEYEVLVRTSPKLPEVKLTDVGFGVSQVLPVIVECFYVPKRSIVIFEQPEIHLHPKVQADLADLFVDAIRAREDGELRNCQFIIESHSEHFLRRLQRRIAEEELSQEDAALYFVHTEGASARIEELDVDAYGNIRNWPEDFFGDEMSDLVARTEAQAKRQQRKARR
jgi:predicted ATPase